MIQGYPEKVSWVEGPLRLCVSTDAPFFRVDFYRHGETFEHVGTSPWQAGVFAPDGPSDQDWKWPTFEFPISTNWKPGVYIGILIEGTTDRTSVVSVPRLKLEERRDQFLFVVRRPVSQRKGTILCKLNLATYHAYNATGGSSFYHQPIRHEKGLQVSLRRPGGGVGGFVPEPPDELDRETLRQTFAHWEAPFFQWLEREKWPVDYCTDLDLHEDSSLFDGHPLMVSVGHDEYWSDAMRLRAERFVSEGGNLAFFSGNVSWRRIEFHSGNTLMSSHKDDRDREKWWKIRPENSLCGVSYRNGGGWWDGMRPPLGFTVQNHQHWVYAGTNLKDGQVFGADERIVGYECDGAAVREAPRGGWQISGIDGTPDSFEILGYAQLSSEWQDLPYREPQTTPYLATLGQFTKGGTVFTAGTTDWARVLRSNEVVRQITRNVLSRLKQET